MAQGSEFTVVSSVHVLMIGSDTTALVLDGASDTSTRLRRYADALERARPGSELTYLVVGAPVGYAVRAESGLRVVPVPGNAFTARISLFGCLGAEHRRRTIDVITTQTPDEDAWVALAFTRRRGIPVVGQIHYDFFSPAIVEGVPRLRRAVRVARRAAAARSMVHFAALRVVGSEVGERLARLPDIPPVHVIPVPAAGPIVASAHRREVVLFIGRLVPEKRLDLWLEVARRLVAARPTVRFEIVGDGPLAEQVRTAVQTLHLEDRIELTGALPPQEVALRLAEARVLLLTSSNEGFGRVLVEAARAGLVAVAVDIPGPRDVVKEGVTGFLRPPAADELAAAVLALLEAPELAGKMGEAARQHVERCFDPEVLTERWMALLVSVARGEP